MSPLDQTLKYPLRKFSIAVTVSKGWGGSEVSRVPWREPDPATTSPQLAGTKPGHILNTATSQKHKEA